ncbi:hypothetical protein AAG906_005961 [Vitis piasezkii]
MCAIQDHTRELIGTGVRRDGLYYFGGAEGDSVQHVSVHNAASTLELWHKRMGHPSEKVVKLLPPVSNLKGDKFASRSRKCVFLGYPFGKKGWKLFDLDTKELFVSRDVKFFEDVFPFSNPVAVNIIPENIVPMVPHSDADLDRGLRRWASPHRGFFTPLSPGRKLFPLLGLIHLGLTIQAMGVCSYGKGMRDKFPSVLLRDFVTHTVVAEVHLRHSVSTKIPRYYLSNDPKSFKEAMKDVGWQKSMHEEIRLWRKMVPCFGKSWVYRTKYFSNGDIERLKSRLVVLGNHQEVGIDYHETFSLVAKMTTVRAFLAIAASKNWELHRWIVYEATPDLSVPIRTWFAWQCSNKCASVCRRSYYLWNDSAALKTFKAYLVDCFKMKDLGVLKYFLGIEVADTHLTLYRRRIREPSRVASRSSKITD